MADLKLQIEREVVVVDVPRRVDVSNTRALVDPLKTEIAAGRRQIVLDFKNTDLIDSTALGALVQIFKSLQQEGGVLVLAEVGDAVSRLFAITRLDTVFQIVASRELAISQLAPLARSS